jgi:4-hydroxyphenylpyruvate dioxygenase-like putative hemolysin
VKDAKAAYERALSLGAWGFDNKAGPMELNIPAIKGIGDSLIYFVDRWRGKDGAQPGASATSASTTWTSSPWAAPTRPQSPWAMA